MIMVQPIPETQLNVNIKFTYNEDVFTKVVN